MKNFGVIFGLLLAACTSAPKAPVAKVASPQAQELASMEDYQGVWEIESCELGGKQAQRIEINYKDNHLVLSRWQWRSDRTPTFTARIQGGTQTLVNYTTHDMRDRYPVVNRSNWSWMDQRIVGTLQWVPGQGDQRGNWSGIAMAQLYINKKNPNTMVWSRWGSTHSVNHGKQDWESRCTYKKVNAIALDKGWLDAISKVANEGV